MANNLSLINNQKLAEILDYIKDEQTLKKTTASPQQLGLLESHAKVKSSVKKRSSQAENDKVNFQNKRKIYRDYVQSLKEGDDGEENEPIQLPSRGKERMKTNVEGFFRQHNIKKTEKGLKIDAKSLNLNYSDLVDDLISNRRKTNTNLSDAQLDTALKELDSVTFPAKYIQSEKLRLKYRKIKERRENPSAQTSSKGHSSRIPVSSPVEGREPRPPKGPPPLFRSRSRTPRGRKILEDTPPSTSTPKRPSGKKNFRYSKSLRGWTDDW